MTTTATTNVPSPANCSELGTSIGLLGASRACTSPIPIHGVDEVIHADDRMTKPEVTAAPRYSARIVSTTVPRPPIARRGVLGFSAIAITAISANITRVSADWPANHAVTNSS